MAEESLIPSALCISGPLPERTHDTGERRADENGSACAQEIFSQDNKLLAQLLTVPVSAAGSRPNAVLNSVIAAEGAIAAMAFDSPVPVTDCDFLSAARPMLVAVHSSGPCARWVRDTPVR